MGILTRNEEIILIAIWKLGGDAYGVSIRDKIMVMTHQNLVYGTLYNSLEYLIRKGYVSSRKGDPTPERGGKGKTIYSVTPAGKQAMIDTRRLNDHIWQDMPALESG